MTTFHSLEGIEGFRWGLFFKRSGEVIHSSHTPLNKENCWPRIQQMLGMLPEGMGATELVFELGRILLRSGAEGKILLFCDRQIKLTAINLVTSSLLEKERSDPNSDHDVTDSNFSLIRTITSDNKAVPAAVVEDLIRLFTEILGPLAPKLAKGLAKKSELDLEHLQEKDWPVLLNLLAGQISVQEKRDRFLDAAVTLKNKF